MMMKRGVVANSITYSTVIKVIAEAGDAARAEHLLSEIVKAGVEPDAVSYHAVIKACAEAGDVESYEHC